MDRDQRLESVSAEFESMEAAAEQVPPGILGILAIYGGYEQAMRQAEEYFAALSPQATFSTTDSEHNARRWRRGGRSGRNCSRNTARSIPTARMLST